jgi:hypothetical protein
MKLWQIYLLNKRPVQVVSHPTPSNEIFVRMIPGDSTSARWVKLRDLDPPDLSEYLKLPLHTQVAKVSGTGNFPMDMLRAERAWPCDPDIDLENANGIRIFRLTRKPREPWRVPRWQSYGWTVEHEGSFEVTYT